MLGVRHLHNRLHVALRQGWARGFLRSLAHLLFPPFCAACSDPLPIGSRGRLCRDCLSSVRRSPPASCPLCGQPHPTLTGEEPTDPHLCGRCLVSPPPLDRAHFPLLYSGAVRQLIHNLKYRGDIYSLKPLVELVMPLLPAGLQKGRCVVPVPLHPSRLRQRGFNQALLIARALFPRSETAPFLLVRTKDTPTQTGLRRKERERNVKGVFQVKKGAVPSRILLVDDVATTGATLSEAARALKRAGAEEVVVFALARSPDPPG